MIFIDNKRVVKYFSDEKIIYTRENQLEAFKTKIKRIVGRSLKHEEFANITISRKAATIFHFQRIFLFSFCIMQGHFYKAAKSQIFL